MVILWGITIHTLPYNYIHTVNILQTCYW